MSEERQRLADAVRHHQRDRNRAPSEPAGKRKSSAIRTLNTDRRLAELLEAVRASLRAKVAALAEDNWMYEAEDEPTIR